MTTKRPQRKLPTRPKAKAKTNPKVKSKASNKTSKRIAEWMSLMQELDTRLPRSAEDVYDTLINNGMPLESFPTFVQEAYKAKKAARKKRPK